MARLQDILNEEVTWNSIKRTPKIAQYSMIKAGRWLKKQNMGPKKCLVYSLILQGLSSYIGLFIGGKEAIKGNEMNAAFYYALGLPLDYAAKVLFFAGGYLYFRKGYNWTKNKVFPKKNKDNKGYYA